MGPEPIISTDLIEVSFGIDGYYFSGKQTLRHKKTGYYYPGCKCKGNGDFDAGLCKINFKKTDGSLAAVKGSYFIVVEGYFSGFVSRLLFPVFLAGFHFAYPSAAGFLPFYHADKHSAHYNGGNE
jgi:hypothetical protein